MIVIAASTAGGCATDDGRHTPANRALAFGALGPFTTGEHPNEVALGDFDGDGDLDIVTAGLVSPEVTWLANRGGGRFVAIDGGTLPAGPIDLVAMGVAGEAADALLVSTFEDGRVQLLRWDGARFGVARAWDLGGDPAYLATGDLDGDGLSDFVVSRAKADDVVPFYADGEGGFVPQTPVAIAGRPMALTVADVDGDDVAEIVVAAAIAGRITVLGADGVGGWRVRGRAETSGWPSSVRVADLDEDGQVELIGATNLGGALFVADVMPRGDGTIELSVREQAAGAGPFGVAVADLDGDGDLDVAVTQKVGDRVTLFSNAGDGTLTPAVTLTTDAGPTPIEAAELDGDGSLDLVVVGAFANTVTLWLTTLVDAGVSE